MNQLPTELNIHSYDRIIVLLSGGKDSVACLLRLLEMGADPTKIHLHHHLVDGRESELLFDWPITEAYCEALAKAFGLPISYSWKQGGLEREIRRNEQPTAPIAIPTTNGEHRYIGGDGPLGTRMKFPQQSANLNVRFCSSYVKIDVFSRWLNNDQQFNNSRTLCVTGERAEESASRANYAVMEPHRSDRRNSPKLQRHIDHLRIVHEFTEAEVWAIIERWKLAVHPAYHLNWGRVSCRLCIFQRKHEWATIRLIAKKEFDTVSAMEKEFGLTIDRNKSVDQLADEGVPFDLDPYWLALANSTTFNHPMFEPEWKLPAGAFRKTCGPT